MASLNLVDWRHPSLRQRLYQARYQLILITALTLVICLYGYWQFLPQLRHQQQNLVQVQEQLLALKDVEPRYDALKQRQQRQQQVAASRRQLAGQIKYLVSLVTQQQSAITVKTIAWLPSELKLSGQYRSSAAVEAFAKTLTDQFQQSATLPVIRVSFPRPQQFNILLQYNS